VLRDGDSVPIAGVIVVVEAQAGSGTAAGAETGPDGRFSVANITSQQYQILAEKPGFLKVSRGFLHKDVDGAVGDEGIEIRMTPQAVVAGRITDSVREPLAGAVVQLSRMYLQGKRTVLSPVSQVTTNDLGEYRIFNIPPGRYYVGAFYQDQASRLGLRERPGAIANQRETATQEYAATYYPGNSQPEAATPVRARGGQQLTGIDIQLSMANSFAVSGVVSGAPSNTPTMRVFLEPFQPGALGALRTYVPATGTAAFQFRSVAPGSYVVRTELTSGGQVLSARERIEVGSANVENIVLDLRPPFLITGTVSVEADDAMPKNLQLRMNGLDRRLLAPIRPRTDGTFEVPVMGPDSYAVDAVDESGTAYVRSVELDGQPVGVNGISIRGPNQILRIVISDKAGRIEGKAVDSNERPTGRGVVVLVGVDSPDDPRRYAAVVGADGSFLVQSLPPGKYRISCFSDLAVPGDATWDVQRRVRDAGRDVEIASADKQQLTLEATLADPQ
jgi:hypothetical protein